MKRKLQEARHSFSKRTKVDNNSFHSDIVHQSKLTAQGQEPKSGSAETGKPKLQAAGVTKFENMLVDDLLFIEVFAGSARLSKAAKEVGFQVLPIDKSTARSSQIFIAQYDLANPDAIQALLDLIRTEAYRIVGIHFAPACGTASKAREKKLVQDAKKGFKICR